MTDPLKSLNERAEISFNKIKDRMFDNYLNNIVKNKPVDNSKLQEIIDYTSKIESNKEPEVICSPEQRTSIKADDVLGFLNRMSITNNQRIAISYIIASEEKDFLSNVKKAIMYLEKDI